MLKLTGAYNHAKVFTDVVDQATVSQIISILNQKSLKNSKIRIMPDCHAGEGCVVGTAMTIANSNIIPNLIGVDIGCGMLAVKLQEDAVDLPAFDEVIHTAVPSGPNVFESAIQKNPELADLRCLKRKNHKVRPDLAEKSLGTLGGGNHFIELDRDSSGAVWLVIHTGSRHLGMEVCMFYQRLGYEQLKSRCNNGSKQEKMNMLIQELKQQGRFRDIERECETFRKTYQEKEPDVPFDLAYCSDDVLLDYLHDMSIVQRHAALKVSTLHSRDFSRELGVQK